ncbi:MAG: hypothetical protein EDM03_03395 [Porphyrobacter sp. IPPAS B-1204]|nr:MAG: hypothetical protein EDM03_03395 [Porphyrobacter sp. IPPAS B-1204]
MRLAAWFSAGLFAVATPAAAQSLEDMLHTGTIPSYLAVNFCPVFLSGESSLENNQELMVLGFPATPASVSDAGFPGFVRLDQTRSDGFVSVGGVSGSICEVNVTGPRAVEALRLVRGVIPSLINNLEPDPANSGRRGDVTVEALKTPEAEFGHLQVQYMETTLGEGTTSTIFRVIYKER